MNTPRFGIKMFAPAFGMLALCLVTPSLHATVRFVETDLVSDIPGRAPKTDPNLVNPWGLAFSGGSPIWVSDNGTDRSTLYNGAGTPVALVVTIPNPGGGTASPTGMIFNATAGAAAGATFNGDNFIFATEDGTIAGWRGALGTTAQTLLDHTGQGSVYKGLAFSGTGAANSYLYATDFHNNRIDVLANGASPALAGNFTDPNMPAGYAPFNIQNLGGKLYVTYAMQDADAHDDVAGPGNGFIDIYNLNGVFSKRLVSHGPLDSPWGMALAPTSWGPYGGDLLVGNFGDGTINAFNPNSGSFVGNLKRPDGSALVIDGLWGLAFGNGAQGTTKDELYFAAGIPGDGAIEDHGLFGKITTKDVPEAGASAAGLTLIGLIATAGLRRRLDRT